ncbi:MAG: hypothetical protein NC548_11270 [Lachnospiraceae bacterium]|nr:hypothetical protein [Lachnospiraceae bacterium]
MFDTDVSLSNILVSMEGVLKIEYTEDGRVEDTIQKAIERLENTYGTTFNTDVYTLQRENQLTADNINLFLRDIRVVLEQLSFFIGLKFFHKNFAITLSDVNYLGYAKSQLLTALQYLQDDKLAVAHHDEIIKPLYNTLNNISICATKRLFVNMLMLDRLGISEGVSVVAQLLYLGGLVR